MDDMLKRVEARFDGWLADFEQAPVRVGVKALLVFLLLRWLWRALK